MTLDHDFAKRDVETVWKATNCCTQVATDTRLWLVSMVRTLRAALQELIAAAVQRAEAEADVLMPGYTHLQPAMTVRWSHWLLSHAAAWQRDDMRLRDLQPRVATLPLGSGASVLLGLRVFSSETHVDADAT